MYRSALVPFTIVVLAAGLLPGQEPKKPASRPSVSLPATDSPDRKGILTVDEDGMEFVYTQTGANKLSPVKRSFVKAEACSFVDNRVGVGRGDVGLGAGLWIFGGMSLSVADKDSAAFFAAKALAGKHCGDSRLK